MLFRYNVFLFDPRPKTLGKQISEIIYDDIKLNKKKESALKWVLDEFPSEDEMGKIVENIIKTEIKRISRTENRI